MGKVRLTKSRFKVGTSCPTKLYYLDRPEFGNSNSENTFLQALAEGGFQVGELAKVYFEGGTEISTLSKDEAIAQTNELLKHEKVIIYEAALEFENLFIRADILVKNKSSIRIIEVKAKSIDPTEEDQFYTKASLKKGPKKINSSWEPYLLDIAFQCHVAKKAFPKFQITGALMLADKSATASVDGLNQKFSLEKSPEGRTSARAADGTSKANVGRQILVEIPADEAIEIIEASNFECGERSLGFEELIVFLSKTCESGAYVKPLVGSNCKSCEFRIGADLKGKFKSGFEQCWAESAKLKHSDFDRQFVFDIWNFRKAAKLIENGSFFMDQLSEEDISPTSSNNDKGLSSSERQWLQVEKVISKDKTTYFDAEGMSIESKRWTYPLHFIDFETTMVAIPFHAGRRPYEQIAFQFSHHKVEEDGTVVHANEYLNRTKGKFPNFDFVRALKDALSHDQGTIFRYAAHENTVLNQIKEQLASTKDAPKDRDDLISFIESITSYSKTSGQQVEGERCMIDLCELVKKYFYSPDMKGSNSIKKVLPAILNSSTFLQVKYGQPIYGSDHGILSKNFVNWKWIAKDEHGAVVDPYKRLPPIFSDLDLEEMDALIMDGSIADGGAAMTAYSRMQFTQMSPEEVDRVCSALLKYCELDTFAMVLIYEHWKNEIQKIKSSKAAAS